MHSTSKLVVFSIGSLVLGLLVAVGGLLAFAASAPGKALLRSYFSSAAYTSVPIVNPDDIPGTPSQPVASGSTSTTTILVPKAFASQDYFRAINRVVPSFNSIITISNELQPTLVSINEQSATGNYSGLLDRIVSAKLLIQREKTAVNELAQGLSALEAANQASTDITTKAKTQELIPTGKALQADLSAQLSGFDELLSGAPATSAQINEALAISKRVAQGAVTFKAQVQSLVDHFAQEIRRASGASR